MPTPASEQPSEQFATARTQEVLADAAKDPATAWRTLLRRSENKLRVLLRCRMPEKMRSHFEEDDLLQEVWLEASQYLDRFEYRGPGSLQKWLAGILRNKLHRAARSMHRIPTPETRVIQANGGVSSHPGLLEAFEKTQPGVSQNAKHLEAVQRIHEALKCLPAHQREAVILRVYEGKTGREAAVEAKVDPSTMSLRFHKGLDALALHLKQLL